MNYISEHITYADAIHSDVAKRNGIKNYFNLEQLDRMVTLAEKVYEPLCSHFNVPIYISSFFRSAKLNDLLGGANNSQHMANNGAAMDIDADLYGKITNKDVFNYIKDNLEFDQLIWEMGDKKQPDWVHVSYDEKGNRKQVLRAISKNGDTQYEPY